MAPKLAENASKQFGALKDFLALEAAGGMVLIGAAFVALLCVNTGLAPWYHAFVHLSIPFPEGPYFVPHSLDHWVNDGLMTIFFLLVGLELKREALDGALADHAQIVLPGIAALGGMLVPALFYMIFNRGEATMAGWAIPTATDIAFSLGILSLAGKNVPLPLKVFLTALAIFDDLGAIIIIALFYSGNLSMTFLGIAAGVIAALWLLNRCGVSKLRPYLVLGFILWAVVLQSGIHATLSGVMLALFIPGWVVQGNSLSPLRTLEHALHPWVAFGILPIFAFVNSGVDVRGLSFESLLHPVTLGILLGLFVGKQVGVFLFSYVLIRMDLGHLPRGSTYRQFYGVCLLTGVGFTMSLFVGSLAFASDPRLVDEVRLGVIAGSLLSGLLGALVLRGAKGEVPSAKET